MLKVDQQHRKTESVWGKKAHDYGKYKAVKDDEKREKLKKKKEEEIKFYEEEYREKYGSLISADLLLAEFK